MGIDGNMRIRSAESMAEMVQACGYLPFFRNQIPGFSVEEHTPEELWFAEEAEGPWEWKGPVIRMTGCAYGKFFGGKAGFVSREAFPDFANWRRGGYDFDARCDEGLARHEDRLVYGVLEKYPSLISREWRALAGMKKRGEFDAAVTRLQMSGYVITADFEYARAKDGRQTGWGLARYATPERFFGEDFSARVYERDPEESRARMEERLRALLPGADAKQKGWVIGRKATSP